MIKFSRILVPALLAGCLLSSCRKDEEDKVELSIEDVQAVNHNNETSTEIPLGGTISVNFEAIAGDDARLDFYHIEIHDHPESGSVSDEYKIIDDDFRDISTFKGLRNAHVHEHITIPDTANLGSYHVVVIVVDEDGYSANTEELQTHITIVE